MDDDDDDGGEGGDEGGRSDNLQRWHSTGSELSPRLWLSTEGRERWVAAPHYGYTYYGHTYYGYTCCGSAPRGCRGGVRHCKYRHRGVGEVGAAIVNIATVSVDIEGWERSVAPLQPTGTSIT